MTIAGVLANPLRGLQQYGQSVWLDYIRRSLIAGGELRRLIDEDGLRGVTSNPLIFEKAIAGSTDYTDALAQLGSERDAKTIYEAIAIRDVQDAADALAAVYEQSNRRDGYVSLEVSPTLADDVDGTVAEAHRLWKAVGRRNVMIKVPATAAGIAALRTLIADGINVNVTLLFSCDVYRQVAAAYIDGLNDRAAEGQDLSAVASVASFFISRIDSAIESAARDNLALRPLVGKVAIANARLAYQDYLAIVDSPEWMRLAAAGAQSQRLLWASTSTKNHGDRDVLYVEELIGDNTVNTIPPATFGAFRDHGRPRASLTEDIDEARDTMERLAAAGIDIDAIAGRLLNDGLTQFVDAFARLMNAIRGRIEGRRARIDRQTLSLPNGLKPAVMAALVDWQRNRKVQRLWNRDASLWTAADENRWLGWLEIADDQLAHVDALQQLAAEIKAARVSHALLLGMGGSSLCPDVLRQTFGASEGYPELHVLDSTDPAQIRAVESRIDLARTLFIVSSKSGGTLEPNIFAQYFFERATAILGAHEAGRRFIAITDPGSHLQDVAARDGYRRIFFGLPSIGGRYSALSAFGMVPAAIMGIDMPRLLGGAQEMAHACGPTVAAADNPGVVLGAALGVLAARGRDKVTLVASPGIRDLGAWLEQLLAESTGKLGKGVIPVDREPLGSPDVYAADRTFVYLRLEPGADAAQDAAVDALERAGQPVIRIDVEDAYSLGAEFFRWEIATAVAGSILGINAFDQPDVEASKIATRALTNEFERSGALPAELPFFTDDDIALFADDANARAIQESAGSDRSLAAYVRAHLNRLSDGDYCALLAYVEMSATHDTSLQAMRQRIRDARRVATCVGFGPRFLHSTGQAYKGGPDSGVFLQITCADTADLAVPGQRYTFGVVKAAQARGDFQVLAERGRRALRVHLRGGIADGLARLAHAIDIAMNNT